MLLYSNRRTGSRLFSLSCTLLDLLPLPAGPPRVSRSDDLPRPKSRGDRPHGLGLHFEALLRTLGPPRGDSSSHEIRVRPSSDITGVRQLPGASPLRHCAAKRRACSALVVSHHLDGLLRSLVCGFVAPRYRTRVRRVSSSLGPAVVPEDGAGPRCLSRDAVHTLRRVSLANSQHRITAACCLLAVTSTNDSRMQPKPRSTVIPGRSRDAPCVPPSEEGGAPRPRPFFRAGDAPIRRGRPPRHRARAAVRPKPAATRATPPFTPGAEAPGVAGDQVPSEGSEASTGLYERPARPTRGRERRAVQRPKLPNNPQSAAELPR